MIFQVLTEVSDKAEVKFRILLGVVRPAHQYAKSVLNPEISVIVDTYVRLPKISKGVLKQKYEQERLSMKEIAKQLSSSKTTIRNYLIRYNIPIRETSKRAKVDVRQFGHKSLGSQSTIHKIEQCVISSIVKMRDEGLSFRSIARVLNDMKVPTKVRGKKVAL